MKWFLMTLAATVLIGFVLPEPAVCEGPAQEALDYFVGIWEGEVIEGDGAGKFKYLGGAQLTKGGKSVLEKGKIFPLDLDWNIPCYSIYNTGSKPDKVVIYYYNAKGRHGIVNGTVKPDGEFFQISGTHSEVSPGGNILCADYALMVNDEGKYTVKFTSREIDGVGEKDLVIEFTRR